MFFLRFGGSLVCTPQAYGFSPVWARSCGATALLVVNRVRKKWVTEITRAGPGFTVGHSEQAYGFSPVWLRSCRGNVDLVGESYGARRSDVRLLARVRPLVRGNGALVGEPPEVEWASRSPGPGPGVSATTGWRHLQGLETAL